MACLRHSIFLVRYSKFNSRAFNLLPDLLLLHSPGRDFFRAGLCFFGVRCKTRKGLAKLVAGMKDDTLRVGQGLAVFDHLGSQLVIVGLAFLQAWGGENRML